MSRKWSALLISTLLVYTFLGGQMNPVLAIVSGENIPADSVSLSQPSASLKVGDFIYLTYSISPENATNKQVHWYSDNPSIAKVSQSGKVIAQAPGITKIWVKTVDGHKTASCTITVTSLGTKPLTEVTLSQSTLSLMAGNWHYLTYTLNPADAAYQSLTWYSENPQVAKVNEHGKVFAINPGTTKIGLKVKEIDGEYKKASCTITVTANNQVPVSGVTLSPTRLSLKVGETRALSFVISPKDATNRAVHWYSDNSKIASVDSSGKVRAVAAGTTKIWVKTNDGHKKAFCEVTVTTGETKPNPKPEPKDPAVPVSGVTLSTDILALAPNQHHILEARMIPENATNKGLTWISSNPAVAKVDQNGKVTALIPGAAQITVTSKEGNHSAVCVVTISAPEPQEIAFKYTHITLRIGDGKQLPLVVAPAGAWAQYTWVTSVPGVAQVDQWGNVQALAAGETEITVSTGSLYATCRITVVAPAEKGEVKFQLDQSKNSLNIPTTLLAEKQELDISQGKMRIVIPTTAWLQALAQLGLSGTNSVLVEVEEFDPVLPTSLKAVGPAYSFHLIAEEVRVSSFADKLLLTISYDPSKVKNPEKLAIYWYNPQKEFWDKLPSLVDSANNQVSVLIDHWSSFALLEPVTTPTRGWLYVVLTALGLNTLLILIWLIKRR
jgi:uncharacterized protein YjdB